MKHGQLRYNWIFACLLIGLGLVAPVRVHGQEVNQAGLVVVHGDGTQVTRCVAFDESEISGLQLLERADIDLNYDATAGFGVAICRIDNEGCNFPEDSCFCQCEGNPCHFWSYWFWGTDDKQPDPTWIYSPLGAGGRPVSDGDMNAWIWNLGSSPSAETVDSNPPEIAFDEVCVPPTATPTITATSQATATEEPTAVPTNGPTATATGTATNTRTPTAVPAATSTTTPTFTPTPLSAPNIIRFAVDRTPINFGESATLSWDVANSESVILHIDGLQEIVAAQGNRLVNPERTTTYVLTARNQGGESGTETIVTVNPAFATPTPVVAETPTETATPLPTDTLVPTNTPVPTETPLPLTATETATMAPTDTHTVTPIPSETPTALTVAIDQSLQNSSEKALVLPALPAEEEASEETDRLRQVMVVGGIFFVVGIPLLFAGIWLIVYSMWKRK